VRRESVRPHPAQIAEDVRAALAEDIGDGDRTASLVALDQTLETRVICRQQAVLAGQAWFDETFRQLDPSVQTAWKLADGSSMSAGDEICRISGKAQSILTAERTGLNFIQTLSASATLARRYIEAVAGTGVTILDTRKTIPGLRLAQKYAVRCGGASNHRFGLYDAILIKENHIEALGSISAAVQRATSLHPELLLEVEVENLQQLDESVASGAQRALLDNFNLDQLHEAVRRYKGRISLEASGGVSLESVKSIADTGVDFISTGDLTKNIDAVDFSMRYL
jgi:nicotinate-nucleotide pyrophosphorylase (carboxylating)